MTLAEIGKRLGQHGLELIASVARPETILAFAAAHCFGRSPRCESCRCRGLPDHAADSGDALPSRARETPRASPSPCFERVVLCPSIPSRRGHAGGHRILQAGFVA